MSIYTEWKNFRDEHVVTMLLNQDSEELERSFEDAEEEDANRATRLRKALDAAQAAVDNELAAQDAEGWLLNGDFPFKVNVEGWLSLYDLYDQSKEKIVASMQDVDRYTLGTVGTITIEIGVRVQVFDVLLPPPNFGAPPNPYALLPDPPGDSNDNDDPEPDVDWRAIENSNVGILNAMFVRGAGESQRSARVFTDDSSILLKSRHDTSDDHPFAANVVGMGTIEFTYNKWSQNEILIRSKKDLNCELVRKEIRRLFDNGSVEYPYRDKRPDFTLRI